MPNFLTVGLKSHMNSFTFTMLLCNKIYGLEVIVEENESISNNSSFQAPNSKLLS